MTEITRRGFLSLCAASLAVVIPSNAEAIAEPIARLIRPDNFEIVRYSMRLIPDSKELIEPGRITVLRAKTQILLRPDRLMLSCSGFNLLHLGANHEPILEGEIDSEIFSPIAYGTRLMFAALNPAEEVIIAAVNRNKTPQRLFGSLIGSSLRERIGPAPIYTPEDFDDDLDDDDDFDERI